jgi:amidohydrolase
MHACGHDGHTAMLLAAAQHFAKNRNFDGTVYLIFQPAEEGGGGAREMIKDGLFDKFPMEAVFGMHNWPGPQVGKFAVSPGPVMASSNEFKITIRGKGSHAALPHNGIDPVPIACQMVQAFQTIISRNKKPIDAGVISVTMIHAGEATNVVPDSCELQGTVRTFTLEVLDMIEKRMQQVAEHVCAAHDAQCEFEFERNYPPTINSAPRPSLRQGDGLHRGRGQRGSAGAHHGRGRLCLHAAGQARCLLLHRQRRRRAPRDGPRRRPLHAAQPELRLQRRPDPAGRHLLGAPGGGMAGTGAAA